MLHSTQIQTDQIIPKLITEDNKRTKYSVQIKTLRKEIDPTSFTGLQSVEKFKCSDGFFRYIYGDFNTYKEAKEGLVKAIEKGYTDAYIINKDVLKKMEKEEKDILNKEEEIKKQQTLAHKDSISGSIYVLQISTSINLIDTKEFKNIDQSKIIVYKGKDKYYRYTFGEFDGFSAAKIQWNELRQIPEYCDAFIVNKDYYKELSVVTPRK
ncbi:MAG: hypothetical protein HY738_16290 [Bacteroidia bacterium]|nr:hypothetical protein [Bacteroidia bacterium]